jgi:hypothetical protein
VHWCRIASSIGDAANSIGTRAIKRNHVETLSQRMYLTLGMDNLILCLQKLLLRTLKFFFKNGNFLAARRMTFLRGTSPSLQAQLQMRDTELEPFKLILWNLILTNRAKVTSSWRCKW